MDRERGIEVLKMCLTEVKKRESSHALIDSTCVGARGATVFGIEGIREAGRVVAHLRSEPRQLVATEREGHSFVVNLPGSACSLPGS